MPKNCNGTCQVILERFTIAPKRRNTHVTHAHVTLCLVVAALHRCSQRLKNILHVNRRDGGKLVRFGSASSVRSRTYRGMAESAHHYGRKGRRLFPCGVVCCCRKSANWSRGSCLRSRRRKKVSINRFIALFPRKESQVARIPWTVTSVTRRNRR